VDCLSFRARVFRCERRTINHVIGQVEGRICLLFTIFTSKNRFPISQIKIIFLLSQKLQHSFHRLSALLSLIMTVSVVVRLWWCPASSGIFRQFLRHFFLGFFCIIVHHSGFTTEMRLYIVQPPVFASVTINTEKDQQLQKAHFVCFNVIHQCIGHDKYRKGPTVTESTFCMFKCYPPFETHFY